MNNHDEKKSAVYSPFPYFGSKKKVAAQIWERFGEPRSYVEPFAGSLAVLLARPEFSDSITEVVNDADGLLANFWRAVKADPDAVAKHVDHPIISSDLAARHQFLLKEADGLQRRLEEDSEFYDPKLAGLWAWGMSSGMKFCVEGKRPTPRTDRSGLGLQRLGNGQIVEYFRKLQERLRRVQIHTGDWERLVRPHFLWQGSGFTAIFLDPPYSTESGRKKRLYRVEDFHVSKAAAKWAIEQGDDPNLRIAFCGLKGEHDFPTTWEEYSCQNDGGRPEARGDERIWFSPHCLRPGSMEVAPKPPPKKPKENCISVNKIQISEGRHRKEFGDLDGLAADIKASGLLQPIGVRSDMTLVFGERRLRACRDLLKWKKIPFRIVNVKSIAHGEFSENEVRKQYTPSERYAIVETLRSFGHGGDRRSVQDRNCDDESLTTAEACMKVGFTKDDHHRVGRVVKNGIPELVVAMDSEDLSISAAAKLAEATADEQQAVLAKPLNEARWTAAKIEKTLSRVRREAELANAEAKPLPENNDDDPIRFFNCRFQDLEAVGGIAPNSVQLVCTDIPYDGDFVAQVEGLSAFAERVLIPGGVFVAYLGQHRLDEKLFALGKHLSYRWLGTSAWEGEGPPIHHLHGICKSIPIAIYSKGKWAIKGRWMDTFVNSGQEKEWHPMQRSINEVEDLIEAFSYPGGLVVDTCGGGFTTAVACDRLGRRCISSEIDKACVIRGQERLVADREERERTKVEKKPGDSWFVPHVGRACPDSTAS